MARHFPPEKAHYGFARRPNTSRATNVMGKAARLPLLPNLQHNHIGCSPNPNLFVYSEAAILPRATSALLNKLSCPLSEPRRPKLWNKILSRTRRLLRGEGDERLGSGRLPGGKSSLRQNA